MRMTPGHPLTARTLCALVAFYAVALVLPAAAHSGGITGSSGPQAAQGALDGRVLDPDGTPVEGVTVTLERVGQQGGEAGSVQTRSDGAFQFDGLAVGAYRLVIAGPGWERVSRRVELDAGQQRSFDLTLRLAAHTERVTVTATGTARDVDLVPGEVTVVERQRVDELQARSLDDVLRYEAGVEIGGTRRLLQEPNIRGFSADRVLVLQDGARVSQFSSGHKGSLFVDVRDVERLEVVRGPASALYGSGALGGVLSIDTRDPQDMLEEDEQLGGSVAYSYSSAYGEWFASPRIFGTTSAGTGFLLGYTGSRNDGVVEVAGALDTIEAAEEDVDAFDAMMATPVGDNGWLRVSFDSYDNSGRSVLNLANVVVDPESEIDRTTRQRTLTVSYEGTTEHPVAEEYRASFYYNDMDLEEERLSDGRFDEVDFRSWGFDARNTSSLGSANRLTYGVEAFRDGQEAGRDGDPNLFFPDGEQTQVGLYLQDEITFADYRVRVVPGIRWDRWSNSPDDPELEETDDSRLNPKLGATVEVTDGLIVSSNYAEGFRTPNFQELFIGGAHFGFPLGPGIFLQAVFAPNEDLEPETSRNVDVGVRYRRGGFRGRVAYYHSWVDDFITVTVEDGFIPPSTVLQTFRNENVQEATLEGIEAAIDWQIDPSWNVWVNYSDPRGSDDQTGEPLGTIPPGKMTLGLDWSSPETGIQAGLASRIVQDHDRVPEGVDPLEGYTLYDVYGSWTPRAYRDLTFRFGIDNLTGEEHTVPIWRMPGTGRDFRTGLTLRFGR